MTQIGEEIKRKINESMMMTGGNTPEEKALWKEGAEYGVSIMQEEVDRLRNSGVKHILEQANEIEVLKDTIESQARKIDRLNHWGAELLKLWGPVDEYVRGLDEVKVGDSVSAKALEILKRIESQEKEIERLTDRIKSMEPELSMLRSYQGMTVTEQNEMIEQISQLKEALREYIEADLRADYMTSILTEEQQKRIQNLLNDKK